MKCVGCAKHERLPGLDVCQFCSDGFVAKKETKMLKIKIFDKAKADEPELLLLLLDVRIVDDGAFEVFACSETGVSYPLGVLWRLRADGRQVCMPGINGHLGLDLDEKSRIRDA